MVLESTIICVDNSDYMRNGDYIPTRLQAQQDAVNVICHAKIRSHPENNVGLVTLGGGSVLLTLTNDVGRILSKLHDVQPSGEITFLSSIRIAQLALKHRQGKNHRQRIVAFVGSPVETEDKELVKLAKKLKKEKVNVDIVNFGEEGENSNKLSKFIDNINGKEGTASHLVSVPPGPMLSEALVNSPILVGEDGQPVAGVGGASGFGGFEFDPNEDPELALALRVSMEEQRARQEMEARRNAGTTETGAEDGKNTAATTEEAMLQSALTPSSEPIQSAATGDEVDLSNMTEEQQIAYALQMSMADNDRMDTTETPAAAAPTDPAAEGEDDLNDPEFLQGVLATLPGVDPSSSEIRNAMDQLTKRGDSDTEKDKNKE